MSTNIASRSGSRPDATTVFASAGTCGCGFDPDTVGPDDAVSLLRALPRRWRSALAFDLDASEPEALLTGRPSGGWSALEHAGHVRDVLHALSVRVQRVLREDDPVLPETHVTPPSGANEQGPGVILAALGHTAEQFAFLVETTLGVHWARGGVRGGHTTTALDLVREAVHEGHHHLLEASSQIEDLRMAAL